MKKMKKSLAIALASVMAATAAPATAIPVKAATTPTINAKYKTTFVGKTRKYSVKNPIKGAKYTWTSSNKKVVTVTSKGLIKGISAGKATITLKTVSGKKTYTNKITVRIMESATSIAISNASEGSTLQVGNKVFDYDFKTTTKSGGPCSDVVRFVIDPDSNTAGAKVYATTGVVNVKKAGSFKIFVRCAASLTKYRAGQYTQTSETITVDVPLDIEPELKAVNKVTIKSNSSLKGYTKDDFTITNTATQQIQKISDFSMSDDGLTITATIATSFANNNTYRISLEKESLAKEFKVSYGSIAKIVAEDQGVAPGIATPIKYTVYDENGIDITQLYPYNLAGMDFTFSPSSVNLDDNGKITLASKNDYAFFSVSYTYVDSKGKPVTISSDTVRVTATASNISEIDAWTITQSGNNVNWNQTSHTIAKGETNRRLYCKFKNSVGGVIDTSRTTISNLSYTSSDTSVLAIDKSNGMLYPYKEGSTTITISDGTFSQKLTITVAGARNVSSLTADKSSLTLSSSSGLSNSETVRFDLKDQYGDNINISSTTGTSTTSPFVKILSGSDNIITANYRPISKAGTYVSPTIYSDGHFNLDFRATSSGTVTVMVTYGGQSTTLTVAVKTPGTVAGYKPSLSLSTLDPNSSNENSAVLTIYSVDSNGLKISTVNEGSYTITNSKGETVIGNQIVNMDGKYDGDIINSSVLGLADGTYTVTVTIGPVKESVNFTVKASDSPVAVYQKQDSITVSTSDDVFNKILDALIIQVNGSDYTQLVKTLDDAQITFTSYDTNRFESGTVKKGNRNFSKTYSGYSVKLRITNIKFTFGQTYDIAPDKEITITVK